MVSASSGRRIRDHGLNADPRGHTEPAPEATPKPTECLTLDDGWTIAPDEFGISTTISGHVSNDGDKAITNYVQITFNALEAAGANLGTCLANTNTTDTNGKWKVGALQALPST
ncbi:FxLYD domain-containing protein [Leucobacter aridicollis]|uniref:FxLYD domain-containing protein n=1 Tax=Leucobacter aridicollis TaxID=283878 RepID=UPI0021081F63|nr:FxLYD domain-containing protein [Leucobacter aridicollis]UTX52308.1 FxLYD domain-containing protein [Leucobacter aridicollis]